MKIIINFGFKMQIIIKMFKLMNNFKIILVLVNGQEEP